MMTQGHPQQECSGLMADVDETLHSHAPQNFLETLEKKSSDETGANKLCL